MAFTRIVAVFTILLSPLVSAAPEADLWSFWDASDESSTWRIDHSPWQQFLQQYLVKGEDGINRVAYREVSAVDSQALRLYLDGLAGVDPRALNKQEQFAYWVNFYNALTVQVVLDNPDKTGILRMGRGFFSIGPWDIELITVADQPVTLNDIEHRILRPIWQDHRIHYAVNCASLGCPNLAGVPYTAANAESLLAQSERDYINHDRGVSFDDRGRLRVSKIFDWYVKDFATSDRELLRYLAGHHDSLADQINGYDGRIRYGYDWSLNAAAE